MIKYSGRFKSEEQYEGIVIKALDNGEYLTLGDVAEIELDAQGYSVQATTNGHPAVDIGGLSNSGF